MRCAQLTLTQPALTGPASRDLLVETILLDPVSREEATFCDSGLDRSTPVRIMRVAPRPPLRWYLVPPEQTQDPSRHAD